MAENQDQDCFLLWFLDSWVFSIPHIARFLHLQVLTYIFLNCHPYWKPQKRGSFRLSPSRNPTSLPNHYICTLYIPLPSVVYLQFKFQPIKMWTKGPTKCEVCWKLGGVGEGSVRRLCPEEPPHCLSPEETPTELKQYRKAPCSPPSQVLKDLRNSFRGFTVCWNNEIVFIVLYEGAENVSQSAS